MSGPWRQLAGPAGVLRSYATTAPPGSNPERVLVLCHELPQAPQGSQDVGRNYPALADRLAEESGWRVVVTTLRGAGGSGGNFSAAGWLDDLGFVLDNDLAGGCRACVVGFGLGGALALRLAAGDARIAGVGVLAAPDDLSAWVSDAAALLGRCRLSGVISDPGYPPDLAAWAAQLTALDPLAAAAGLGERPLLVVHGAADGEVPVTAAHAIAAAGHHVDLRIVPGAGHWLRADPRVVATLIGWLERQR